MKILFDDHIHLRAHTKPPRPHELEPVLRSAKERGVTPGIREHAPLPLAYRLGEYKDFEYAMFDNEVERFMGLFAGSGAAMGFEVDYLRGYEDETRQTVNDILARAQELGIPISGLNGSVHLLPGEIRDLDVNKGDVKDIIWDLDENIFIAHIRQRGAERVLDDYFSRITEMILFGMFDALSHLELIRKFDRLGPDGKSIYFRDVEELYRDRSLEILELAGGKGMAVELNTAGLKCPLGRPYLSNEFLAFCAQKNVPVCIGSDSHTPDAITFGFDTALDMCLKAGIKSVVTFRHREMIRAPLE